MLHRQLTDEMNLELEQRRKDFEQRSRQLEEQSRCGLLAMCACCLHILTYSLFSRREIAELKVLLESQTDLNASLQRELQEGQQKAAVISKVKLTPFLHCKAHCSFYSHCCYRCILPQWTQCSSLMTSLSPAFVLCVPLWSLPVMLTFMTSSSNNPVSLLA